MPAARTVGPPQKGRPAENTFSSCSVVLGTFQKLAPQGNYLYTSPLPLRGTRLGEGGFGHLKCLTLGLGRLPKFSHGVSDSHHAVLSEMV